MKITLSKARSFASILVLGVAVSYASACKKKDDDDDAPKKKPTPTVPEPGPAPAPAPGPAPAPAPGPETPVVETAEAMLAKCFGVDAAEIAPLGIADADEARAHATKLCEQLSAVKFEGGAKVDVVATDVP